MFFCQSIITQLLLIFPFLKKRSRVHISTFKKKKKIAVRTKWLEHGWYQYLVWHVSKEPFFELSVALIILYIH
jgi:hypothetical protein